MSDSSIHMTIEGMTCKHCASTVEGIIEQQGGSQVKVDYLMGEAVFHLSDEKKLVLINKKLKNAGYESTGAKTNESSSWSTIDKKFAFTLPFSLLLFTHMFFPHDAWINNGYVQLGISLPVFLLGVHHFGKSTISALLTRNINMDILILLGSTSAFAYSLIGLVAFGPDAHAYFYFETTATIISLVLLGYVIEHRAVKRTTASLRALVSLAPEKAKKLVPSGLNQDLEIVDASTLQPGDQILLNEGDSVPADGTLLHGEIETDQSMLTGESRRLQHKKGDDILSGSLVTSGNATLLVEQASADSTLGRIIALAKESRMDQPRIQRLADKISSVFVPSVLLISLAFFAVNFWILGIETGEAVMRSIAVLVISCPCAMGLATPTAVSVGLGLASKLGIIIKRASTLETLKSTAFILMDKTGTLTTNQIELDITVHSSKFARNEIIAIAKALEQHSNHPIADAVQRLDTNETTKVEDAKELKGKGLSGKWNGKEVKIGSAKFTAQSATADLCMTLDGELVATFSRIESLKSDAEEVVSALRKTGRSLAIISGDANSRTKEVSTTLGIKNYHGEMLPAEKLDFINDKKTSGIVAMVGDGINDGPALSAADVGISIGTKNALASDSADVVLINDQLSGLEQLFRISEKTVAAIRQNLYWALSYNLIAIPLAGLGYLDPMLAALSMAFSDVVVIGNSLRLRFILPKSIR